MPKEDTFHIYDGEPRFEFALELKSWQEIPIGGLITQAGNGKYYHTSFWRTQRAVWIEERCIQCFRCWVSCPDCAWKAKDKKIVGVDYRYCKGCGICDRQCPVEAIYMTDEEEEIDKASELSTPETERTPDFWPHMKKEVDTD